MILSFMICMAIPLNKIIQTINIIVLADKKKNGVDEKSLYISKKSERPLLISTRHYETN